MFFSFLFFCLNQSIVRTLYSTAMRVLCSLHKVITVVHKFKFNCICTAIAYCDVPLHLSCHSWLVREAQRYGKKWDKKWAQEKALQLVSVELPSVIASHAHPLDSELFPSWSDFLKVFISEGGLIEGTPPSESVTSLSVDLFIQPTGVISIAAMRDQVLYMHTVLTCTNSTLHNNYNTEILSAR